MRNIILLLIYVIILFIDSNCNSNEKVSCPKRIKISVSTSLNNQTAKEEIQDCNELIVDLCDADIIPNTKNSDNLILHKTPFEEMEEMLKCNICSDIMYYCTSIRPCLHTFCGVCLLEWKQSGDNCPMCRGPIDGVSKNHLITNIIEKYLEEHPDKVRPQNERDEADLKIFNGKNQLFFTIPSTSNAEYSALVLLNNCPYCNYPNFQNSNLLSINLSDTPLSQYECGPLFCHSQCQCCSIYIPIFNNDEIYPNQKCRICNRIFCSLLLGNCRNCTHGCLHTLKDFMLNPDLNSTHQVPQFLPENFYETNVLRMSQKPEPEDYQNYSRTVLLKWAAAYHNHLITTDLSKIPGLDIMNLEIRNYLEIPNTMLIHNTLNLKKIAKSQQADIQKLQHENDNLKDEIRLLTIRNTAQSNIIEAVSQILNNCNNNN